jgi:uncharacterized protein (TIGR02145 family)
MSGMKKKLTSAKTANDPCPAGWRLPTTTEWTGVNANNTVSRSGAWTNTATYYNSALHYGPDASTKLLTLPATGYRIFTTGSLSARGTAGLYWSSTEDLTNSNLLNANLLNFNVSAIKTVEIGNRVEANSVRCIAE